MASVLSNGFALVRGEDTRIEVKGALIQRDPPSLTVSWRCVLKPPSPFADEEGGK
ncbi:MAG: hypothetical protein KatS3mg016_1076 [Fimbriimonadales bacterium]|nr:MAG: hypothetical protein KatS3mg016_1076 [Fimbriimonadales bacterium]